MTGTHPSRTGHGSRTIPRELWPVALGFSGVWLVWLFFTAGFGIHRLVSQGQHPPAVALGGLTVLFAATYLMSFVAPRLILRWSQVANSVAYTAVLVGCALCMIPHLGVAAIVTVPYIAAVWLIPYPLRVGLTVAALLGLVLAVVLITQPMDDAWGGFIGVSIGMVALIIVRITTAREDALSRMTHELGLAEQREQIARDVHDVVGHALTAVHLKAQLVDRLIATDPQRAQHEARQIVALTRGALSEVRQTVDGLNEPDLAVVLAGARRTLADAGVRVDFPSPDAIDNVPEPTAALFAWVVREACTNVLRHAGASRVRITLSPTRLTVTDNGLGIRADAASPRTGLGVRGIEQRVQATGGSLTITDANPGHERPGTRVEVTV